MASPFWTRARGYLEGRMSETVSVTRETPGDPDPTTLAPTTVLEQHYAGRARIKYVAPRVLEREVGGQFPAAQELEAHFPSGTTGILTDDIVTVTASTEDPTLVGLRYRVKGVGQAGQTTAYRVPVEILS